MEAPALIVMAAGIGSRYGGLKQMDPVGPCGERIVDYSVYDAVRAGFGKVVFVIRKEMAEAFREEIGRPLESRIETVYVYQGFDPLPPGFRVPAGRTKPWGTAHAVLVCRHAVTSPFAVINGDDFYGPSAFQVLHDRLVCTREESSVQEFSLVGYRLENTLSEHGHVSRGVCELTPEGYLRGIRERVRIERRGSAVTYTEDGRTWTELPGDSAVSMNLWGFTPGLFKELETRFGTFLSERGTDPKAEFFLPDVVGAMVDEGRARVRVLLTDERWFGITYREDKPLVERAIRAMVGKGLYPSPLWG